MNQTPNGYLPDSGNQNNNGYSGGDPQLNSQTDFQQNGNPYPNGQQPFQQNYQQNFQQNYQQDYQQNGNPYPNGQPYIQQPFRQNPGQYGNGYPNVQRGQAPGFASPGMKFCIRCGSQIYEDAIICPYCGCQVGELQQSVSRDAPSNPTPIIINNNNVNTNTNVMYGGTAYGKPRDKWVSLLLCFFLGAFGAHKFYEGKIGMGILYLFTLGLFGIGVLIDLILILLKPNPYYV